MVTETEGYETVKRALEALLEETRKTLVNTEKLRDKTVEDIVALQIHKKTEIAKLTHEITELDAEKTQKSKPFDEKIALLKTEIQTIEETKKSIAQGLASRGKTDIAQKIEPGIATRICDLCGKPHENKGVGSVCPDCIKPPKKDKYVYTGPPAKVTLPVVETGTVDGAGVKHEGKERGSRNKRLVGKAIIDFCEKFLSEGRWETIQSVAKMLANNGYPSKHTPLYASKALNTLKWEGKAVSFKKGNKVFWKSAKFPELSSKDL